MTNEEAAGFLRMLSGELPDDSDKVESDMDEALEMGAAALENPMMLLSADGSVRPLSEPGWRPIETAPKDGTAIRCWKAGWSCCRELCWDKDYLEWVDQVCFFTPTHWHALLAPPSGFRPVSPVNSGVSDGDSGKSSDFIGKLNNALGVPGVVENKGDYK